MVILMTVMIFLTLPVFVQTDLLHISQGIDCEMSLLDHNHSQPNNYSVS